MESHSDWFRQWLAALVLVASVFCVPIGGTRVKGSRWFISRGLSSSNATCATTVMVNGVSHSFATCLSLSDGGYLAWTEANGTMEVVYENSPSADYGWIAWGLSPDGLMRNANITVGYCDPSNTSQCRARVYKTDPELYRKVTPDINDLNVDTARQELEVIGSTRYRLRFTIKEKLSGSRYMIWGGGPGVMDYTSGMLMPHSVFKLPSAQIDFSVGSTAEVAVANQDQKIAHAGLAAVGFGVMMPLGILVARHVKVFLDPLWFYTHIALQFGGFVVGVAGWSVGMWLYSKQPSFDALAQIYQAHFGIGVAIFCAATLQILTPVVKPDKKSERRLYWNLAHWFLGYSAVILSIVNIFLGFGIFRDQGVAYGGWQTAYIVVIAVWGGILLLMEPVTWMLYLRKAQAEEPHENGVKAKGDDV